jgi:predicted nucleotidyltransferase
VTASFRAAGRHEDVRDQTDDIVRLVYDVLGSDLVGAYLHGSAVLGGLRPASDIDVLVVARRRTTSEERRALVDRLLAVSGGGAGSADARPVELTVVAQSDVRPWRYPPRSEFQYGEWLRREFEQGIAPSPGASPDLALLITMALLGDRPLIGPPPAEVLDPVPRHDLLRAVVAGVPDLIADLEWDTRNVILTLARIWMTLATGEIGSKDAAADWSLARLPEEHRAVLAHARAVYLGDADERWDDLAPVRSYVDHVGAEIERLAPRAS